MLSALHDHSLNIKFKNLIKNHENAMVYVHAGNNRCITIDSVQIFRRNSELRRGDKQTFFTQHGSRNTFCTDTDT